MNPARLTVRFRALQLPDDLEPTIEVFHRFIQRGRVEGLVLDVADYRHVPQGPGVLLVGHDVDYGINDEGFTVVRKRSQHDDAATQLRDALRMALGAMEELDYDGALDATFEQARFTVAVPDRRLGDRAEVEEALRQELTPVVTELYGPDAIIARLEDDDPRRAPELVVTAANDAAAGVLAKLGGSQAPGQSPWDIRVEELKRLIDNKADFVLLDVREESEYETVNLGGTLIPLAELEGRLDELDREAHIVVHCRSGRRGGIATQQLRDAGFTDAWNVSGALAAWADRIDPSTPRY